MPLGSTLEGDLLNLMLCAKPIANIADNASASPSTATWTALHTADPSSGDQTTNEIAYTAYARTSVVRSTAGYTVTGSGPATASPVAAITFPACTTASTVVASYWSVGLSSNGTGKMIGCGAISPTIALGSGVTPQLTTSSSFTMS